MIKKIIHNLPYIKKLRKLIFKLVEERNDVIHEANRLQMEIFKIKKNLSFEEKLQFYEMKFGGYSTNVIPTSDIIISKKNSPHKHTGGDRFNVFYHDYSKIYARYLSDTDKIDTILEIGILKGTGLAIWCQLFPKARVFGFDWDLGNYKKNYDFLISLGAFQFNRPNTYIFDQFKDNTKWLKDNFSDIKFNFVIDDAYHSDETIINSFEQIKNYLAENFVYIIEDNETAWQKLKKLYPQYKFDNQGEITVITK